MWRGELGGRDVWIACLKHHCLVIFVYMGKGGKKRRWGEGGRRGTPPMRPRHVLYGSNAC